MTTHGEARVSLEWRPSWMWWRSPSVGFGGGDPSGVQGQSIALCWFELTWFLHDYSVTVTVATFMLSKVTCVTHIMMCVICVYSLLTLRKSVDLHFAKIKRCLHSDLVWTASRWLVSIHDSCCQDTDYRCLELYTVSFVFVVNQLERHRSSTSISQSHLHLAWTTTKSSWRKGYARQCHHLANAFKVLQRKFRRKFELIAVQGHPRLATLVPIESEIRICNYLLVVNSNFGRISYRFRDIDA